MGSLMALVILQRAAGPTRWHPFSHIQSPCPRYGFSHGTSHPPAYRWIHTLASPFSQIQSSCPRYGFSHGTSHPPACRWTHTLASFFPHPIVLPAVWVLPRPPSSVPLGPRHTGKARASSKTKHSPFSLHTKKQRRSAVFHPFYWAIRGFSTSMAFFSCKSFSSVRVEGFSTCSSASSTS